jgi:hypothetical protein
VTSNQTDDPSPPDLNDKRPRRNVGGGRFDSKGAR